MNNWRIWDNEKEYGGVFLKRATALLPEMECSKAVAEIICDIIQENDVIVDIGCGGGHYLVSLDKRINCLFNYYGFDATAYYIELARKAFFEKINTNPLRLKTVFEIGDIYNLPVKDQFADITMCNNLLLHLPSIEKPIKELWRIAKKYVIIRTLIGKVSFRIKQIIHPEGYTEEGEPLNFHYLNIYSEEYIKSIIDTLDYVDEYKLFPDTNFNSNNIGLSNYEDKKIPHNVTTIINGMQVNNYIILPWHFIIIKKNKVDLKPVDT